MLPRFCPCQPLSWLETLGVISLVFPLLGMYKEFVSCKSAVTAILYIQTHFLGLQPNNMKSIFFSRQHTYRTEKEASQFLNKLLKYEKTARQKYCWMANFPKTLLWICSPKLQPKNHQLYSSVRLSMLTREDIVDTSTRIWTHFYVWKRSLIKMRKSRNDQFHRTTYKVSKKWPVALRLAKQKYFIQSRTIGKNSIKKKVCKIISWLRNMKCTILFRVEESNLDLKLIETISFPLKYLHKTQTNFMSDSKFLKIREKNE